jgi:hypothetical protein
MVIRMEGMEEFVVSDSASPLSRTIVLAAAGQPGDAISFEYTGSLSAYPEDMWKDGDATVKMNYTMRATAPSAVLTMAS